jgi:hypothetical protein
LIAAGRSHAVAVLAELARLLFEIELWHRVGAGVTVLDREGPRGGRRQGAGECRQNDPKTTTKTTMLQTTILQARAHEHLVRFMPQFALGVASSYDSPVPPSTAGVCGPQAAAALPGRDTPEIAGVEAFT